MTVADDLSTLRGTLNQAAFGSESTSDLLDADAALDRVEAEIARLTEEKDGWQEEARAYELRLRRYDATAPWEAQVALAEAMCEKAEQRAETAEAEVARLRDGLRRRNELIAKTIYNPPGWTGPDMWWADEARALLAEDGAPPIDAETWGLMQDGAAQPLPRSEYGGYMGGEPWGPDHPSYDEMGQ